MFLHKLIKNDEHNATILIFIFKIVLPKKEAINL
jgi:hypothetical protein